LSGIPFYIDQSTHVKDKGELGTFASKDLPKDFDLGYAVDIPMGSQRPSLDWKRSELCKMTNHSFQANLKQESTRYGGGVIVHYITNKPINKGEELLVNYKEFEFNKLIDLSFLEPSAGKYMIYYRIPYAMLKFHKNFGICSPQRILELRGKASGALDDLFDSPNFKCDSVEKCVSWMNSQKPYMNALSIMFSMFPLTEYHESYMKPCIEFKVDTLKFHSFIPSLIYGKKVRKKVFNWDRLRNDDRYDEMRKLISTPYSAMRGDPVILGVKDLLHMNLELCDRTYRKYDEEGNFEDVSIRR